MKLWSNQPKIIKPWTFYSLTLDCSHRFYFSFSHCWEKAVVIAPHLSSSLFVIVCWTQPKCSDKLHCELFYKNKCAVTKPATNYCTLKIESACLIISLERLPLIESYLIWFIFVTNAIPTISLYLNEWLMSEKSFSYTFLFVLQSLIASWVHSFSNWVSLDDTH